MSDEQGEPVDPLTRHWYAQPNDLIGGWCVMPTDSTPGLSGQPEVADFTTQEAAEHIAALHNASLSELAGLTAEALDNPTPRMLKVLAAAEELGWTTGRITIAVRLSKPDDKPGRDGAVAQPFYAIWELRGRTPKGKPSWTFVGARAKNSQPLSESDIYEYLADPSLIYPEPPKEVTQKAAPGQPCYCDYFSIAPHTHPEGTA